MSTPEGQLLRLVLDYLAARGVLAFRMQVGAVSAEHKGKTRFMRFGTPGMADVLAFRWNVQLLHSYSGCDSMHVNAIMPIWIECKAPKGQQTPLQQSFQQQVEQHGHRYVIARTLQDVENSL